MLKNKAMELSKYGDFIASKGWVEKFRQRYGVEIMKEQKGRKKKQIL